MKFLCMEKISLSNSELCQLVVFPVIIWDPTTYNLKTTFLIIYLDQSLLRSINRHQGHLGFRSRCSSQVA